jgi:hypothetical protein
MLSHLQHRLQPLVDLVTRLRKEVTQAQELCEAKGNRLRVAEAALKRLEEAQEDGARQVRAPIREGDGKRIIEQGSRAQASGR